MVISLLYFLPLLRLFLKLNKTQLSYLHKSFIRCKIYALYHFYRMKQVQ